MQTRVAVMAIIVEKNESIEKLNTILHEYSEHIIGRMGIPYRKAGVSIICIALDAPQNMINTLAGEIGRIPGVSTKTIYSKIRSDRDSLKE